MLKQIILYIILSGIGITVLWAIVGLVRHIITNRPRRRIKEFFRGMINNEYLESERPYLNEEINN